MSGPKNGIFRQAQAMAGALGGAELALARLHREKMALHEAYERWEQDARRFQEMLAAVVQANGGKLRITALTMKALPPHYQLRMVADGPDGVLHVDTVEPPKDAASH